MTLACVEKIEEPTCPKCGSNNVGADAAIYWDRDGGWIATDAGADEGFCCHCEASEIVFKWVSVPMSVPE